MLELKEYQKRSLEVLEAYLKKATTMHADTAFYDQTRRPYREVQRLPDLPYVCLRIPTGGGKTLMACHALGIAARDYLQAERTVCLWLVPTNTIRDQTLAALRARNHPYRQAVASWFSGQITVMDLTEALYVQRGTLDGETCIIVSTLAALRVEDTDGRKVYETCGALQHHFHNLGPCEEWCERREDGTVPYSLANVLRMRRPVIIMDEAHNARTPLSFETLARLWPSCILEFTATPETTHRPEQGSFASNILHHVSAAELKAEDMVKLPIKLRTRPDWKEIVADAIQTQRHLENLALEEERETGEYLRPIVLLQAQPRSQNHETLTVEVVKQTLVDDFRIPEEQIAIATGQTREIDDVDLFARDCPLRYIITVQALKEGWDCAFAYVLCSVAEMGSTRAVEQILGRILRLPRAERKSRPELNCAYALAASPRFIAAAQALTDALVENGFQRIEAGMLVVPQEETGSLFEPGTLWSAIPESVADTVSEAPELSRLEPSVRNRVTYTESTGELRVTGEFTEQDRDLLRACFSTSDARATVDRLHEVSQERAARSTSPSARNQAFRVPCLGIRVDGQLELFEESHFLGVQWDLSECSAALSEAEFSLASARGGAGEVDVSEAGRVEIRFVDQLHDQLSLLGAEPGWDMASLVNWLDRQIALPLRHEFTRAQSSAFIHRIVTYLCEERGLPLDQLARHKFRLRNAVTSKLHTIRDEQAHQSYQRMLFQAGVAEIEVDPALCLSYSADRYSPNWYYEGTYRWRKHFFPLIGELQPQGEEFECALFLDQMEEVEYWVRNLERRVDSSFWLQTSTDRFYPDFVATLRDGRILVVEYKGEDRWSNDDSREKRAVGELWAERSQGMCLFIMPRGRDLGAISQVVVG
ncbi:MAG: DEAD/DEAH box helicase family protein [Phycisphaerae bacterium]|nr:DEAD/DEAH box helicase family protein [Phycisphaerae bacterium]